MYQVPQTRNDKKWLDLMRHGKLWQDLTRNYKKRRVKTRFLRKMARFDEKWQEIMRNFEVGVWGGGGTYFSKFLQSIIKYSYHLINFHVTSVDFALKCDDQDFEKEVYDHSVAPHCIALLKSIEKSGLN